MRIISGSARGRKLKGPPSHATRPMTDKLKGAVFNSLASLGIEPEHVLDLYAGTGAIGIEALSRGAIDADFVDMGSQPCGVIRDNLQLSGFSDRGRVHKMPVMTFVDHTRQTYDFIVMDPPYADPEIIPTLEKIEASTLVQPGTIVLLGHSKRVHTPERVGRLDALRQRCHGDTCFTIYEAAGNARTSDDSDEEQV